MTAAHSVSKFVTIKADGKTPECNQSRFALQEYPGDSNNVVTTLLDQP